MTYFELARQLAEINKGMMMNSDYTKMTDINRGESLLLSCLANHDDRATPTELSEALHVSTARIAALLNKMERKNLVAREKHPENNRNVVVSLLPAGKKLHGEQEEAFNREVINFFETLGEEKAALYVELQNELANFLKNKQKGDRNNG
ncbi:MAG: MarR family transcriptional regulator [Porcipelethomonas sp.]